MAFGIGFDAFKGAAASAAASAGIPVDVLNAVVQKESSWNPAVPVGKAGDTGLGQLTPGVYNDPKYNGNGTLSPYNPDQNLQISANYLGALYKQTGNWTDALSKYNTGKSASASSTGAAYASSVLGIAGPISDPTSPGGNDPEGIAGSIMDKLNQIFNYQVLSPQTMGAGSLTGLALPPAEKIVIVIAGGAVILLGLWQLVKDPISSVSGAATKIALAAA